MNIVEKIFGIRVIRSKRVAIIFEEVHLRRFLKCFKIDCVFDIGANNGQYATLIRKLGYKGVIISFEPIPEAAEILREKAKKDPNWHIEEMALDSVTGTKSFNVMNGNQFSSLHEPSHKEVDLFEKNNSVSRQITVQTSTLKDVYEKYKKLLKFKRPFLKMDTQGHDLEIAQGGEEVLPFFVGLQSELSIKKIYDGIPDYKRVIEYYNSMDFELSAFVPNNEGHFPRLIEIDCIMFNKKFSL